MRNSRRVGVIVAALALSAGVAILGAGFTPPAPASPPTLSAVRGLAHLWIDMNGGSCTRSSKPAAYDDGRACASAEAAYNVAKGISRGSTVLIKGGAYSRFRIVGSRRSSQRIVFAAAPGEHPRFTGGYMDIGVREAPSQGPDYVTLRNLAAARFGSSFLNPDNRYGIYVGPGSTHIRLVNMRAGNFLIQGAQDVAIVGGEYGPCRAAEVSQPCEINKVDHSPGTPQPMNIVIHGVYFHDYDLGPSCFAVADGGSSTGRPDCHWRAMYLNGVHNLTLRNSRFRDSFIAPWTTISGPDAARVGNKNILIENNVFGTGISYGNPGKYTGRSYGRWEAFQFAWCQNAAPGVVPYANITYRFNSSSRSAGVEVGANIPEEARCVWRNVRVYGNIGLRNWCNPRVSYRYNVYSNRGKCHSTDVSLGRSRFPFYAKDTHAPGPFDFKLRGRRAAPDNRVPASAGCPARDRFGSRRGRNGFCDAGAGER